LLIMRGRLAAIALLCLPTLWSFAHADPDSLGAQRFRFDSLGRGQTEVGLIAAYGESHRIPAIVTDRARFNLIKLRLGRFLSPRVELAGEFAAAAQNGPRENRGWSAAGCLRHYISVRGDTAVAWDFSVGVTRFERRLTSQATRINFTEQLGIAVQYGVGPNSAITIEYKFSHNSNAGLRMPNLGINASIIGVGWSWYP